MQLGNTQKLKSFVQVILTWRFFLFLLNFLVLNFQAALETKFDDLFGTSAAIDPFNFNSQNGMRKDDK